MFSSFPAPDSGDAQSAVLAYRMAIDGIGTEFVASAVRRFIRGEVKRDRHAFLPTAPELAIEARRLQNEERAARYVPLPKPKEPEVSPEMRTKVQAMMDGLAAKMKRGEGREWPESDLSPEQELEMMAGLPVRTTNAAALIETLEKRKEA